MANPILTVVIGTYPPRFMELLVPAVNRKFNSELRTLSLACPQFKPGLCSTWKSDTKTWLVNRHHRSELESLVREYYGYLTVRFRRE
jgi:hypothetical protein